MKRRSCYHLANFLAPISLLTNKIWPCHYFSGIIIGNIYSGELVYKSNSLEASCLPNQRDCNCKQVSQTNCVNSLVALNAKLRENYFNLREAHANADCLSQFVWTVGNRAIFVLITPFLCGEERKYVEASTAMMTAHWRDIYESTNVHLFILLEFFVEC